MMTNRSLVTKQFSGNQTAMCTDFSTQRPYEYTIETLADLEAAEAAKNLTGVPMPAHVRERLERLFNLPPVYTPDDLPLLLGEKA